MNWLAHLSEHEVALHAGGDLSGPARLSAKLHLLGCPSCRARLESYVEARRVLRDSCEELPPGLDWDALSAEMTANIHLGLAAGAIVDDRQPRNAQPSSGFLAPASFQAAAVFASLAIVLASTWLLEHNSGRPAMTTPVRAVLQLPSGAELKSVDFDGAERARQLDGETGQVTITQVYAD